MARRPVPAVWSGVVRSDALTAAAAIMCAADRTESDELVDFFEREGTWAAVAQELARR